MADINAEEDESDENDEEIDSTQAESQSPHLLRRILIGLFLGWFVAGAFGFLLAALVRQLGVALPLVENWLTWLMVGMLAAIADRYAVLAGATTASVLGGLHLVLFQQATVAANPALLLVSAPLNALCGALIGGCWFAVRNRFNFPNKP